mmetsp:Transcript_66656/g.182827  ORF Transcript_66656/g.182827 Transcript_66656/m.182827 type:complete len:586 (-) Transcript_66656:319-2076(-)
MSRRSDAAATAAAASSSFLVNSITMSCRSFVIFAMLFAFVVCCCVFKIAFCMAIWRAVFAAAAFACACACASISACARSCVASRSFSARSSASFCDSICSSWPSSCRSRSLTSSSAFSCATSIAFRTSSSSSSAASCDARSFRSLASAARAASIAFSCSCSCRSSATCFTSSVSFFVARCRTTASAISAASFTASARTSSSSSSQSFFAFEKTIGISFPSTRGSTSPSTGASCVIHRSSRNASFSHSSTSSSLRPRPESHSNSARSSAGTCSTSHDRRSRVCSSSIGTSRATRYTCSSFLMASSAAPNVPSTRTKKSCWLSTGTLLRDQCRWSSCTSSPLVLARSRSTSSRIRLSACSRRSDRSSVPAVSCPRIASSAGDAGGAHSASRSCTCLCRFSRSISVRCIEFSSVFASCTRCASDGAARISAIALGSSCHGKRPSSRKVRSSRRRRTHAFDASKRTRSPSRTLASPMRRLSSRSSSWLTRRSSSSAFSRRSSSLRSSSAEPSASNRGRQRRTLCLSAVALTSTAHLAESSCRSGVQNALPTGSECRLPAASTPLTLPLSTTYSISFPSSAPAALAPAAC